MEEVQKKPSLVRIKKKKKVSKKRKISPNRTLNKIKIRPPWDDRFFIESVTNFAQIHPHYKVKSITIILTLLIDLFR